MEEKIIEAAKELLIQIHEKEKMSDFEITIATETLRVLLHSVLNGLSERDKFAMEFAEWILKSSYELRYQNKSDGNKWIDWKVMPAAYLSTSELFDLFKAQAKEGKGV